MGQSGFTLPGSSSVAWTLPERLLLTTGLFFILTSLSCLLFLGGLVESGSGLHTDSEVRRSWASTSGTEKASRYASGRDWFTLPAEG